MQLKKVVRQTPAVLAYLHHSIFAVPGPGFLQLSFDTHNAYQVLFSSSRTARGAQRGNFNGTTKPSEADYLTFIY